MTIVLHGINVSNNNNLLVQATQRNTSVEQIIEDVYGKLMADVLHSSMLSQVDALLPLQNALISLHQSNPNASLVDWTNKIQIDNQSDLIGNSIPTTALPIFKGVTPLSAQQNDVDRPPSSSSLYQSNSFSYYTSKETSSQQNTSNVLSFSNSSDLQKSYFNNTLEFLDYGNISNGEIPDIGGSIESIVDPLSYINPVNQLIDRALFHPVSTIEHPIHTIKQIFKDTVDLIIHPWHVVKDIVKPFVSIFKAISSLFGGGYKEFGGLQTP